MVDILYMLLLIIYFFWQLAVVSLLFQLCHKDYLLFPAVFAININARCLIRKKGKNNSNITDENKSEKGREDGIEVNKIESSENKSSHYKKC